MRRSSDVEKDLDEKPYVIVRSLMTGVPKIHKKGKVPLGDRVVGGATTLEAAKKVKKMERNLPIQI